MPVAEKRAIVLILERLLLVWLLIVALGLGLFRLGLSPLLESSQALGWAVKKATEVEFSFSSSSVNWRGWKPWVISENVQLGDLKIDRLELELDPFQSLATGELVFTRFSLHGLDVLVEQTEQGWQLLGKTQLTGSPESVSSTVTTDEKPVDKNQLSKIVQKLASLSGKDFQKLQQLRQLEELDVSDARIRVKLINQKEIVFDELYFNAAAAKNDKYQILFQGSWIGAQWQAQLELNEQGGQGYFKLPEHLPRQLSQFLDQSYQLDGRLNNGVWFEWNQTGKASLLADFSLESPSMSDGSSALLLQQLQARLELMLDGQQLMVRVPLFRWSDEMHQGELVNLSIDLTQQGQIQASLQQAKLDGFEIFSRVPGLPAAAKNWLDEGFPKGKIRQLQFSVSPEGEMLSAVELDGISVRSVGGIPGVENLSGTFAAAKSGVLLELNSQKMSLLTDELFRWPLPMEYAKGMFAWQPTENGWLLKGKGLDIQTPHARVTGEVYLKDSPERPLWSSWLFSLHQARANQVGLYLPSGIMGRGLVRWLDRSILDGKAEGGVIVQGQLANFPWHQQPDGLFEVRVDATDGEFQFLPEWPALHDVVTELVFRGNGMDITATHARLDAGAQADAGRVWINNFSEPDLQLHVTADVKGPVKAGVKYIRTSPLNNILGEVFDALELDGKLSLALGLTVGLEDGGDTTVVGDIDVTEGRFSVVDQPISLTDVSGQMRFSEKDFNATGLQGIFFDQPAEVTIDYRDNAAQILLESSMAMANLPILVPDLEFLGKIPGKTNFTASYLIDTEKQRLDIYSDMKGVVLPFITPFYKEKNQTAALKVRYYPELLKAEVELQDRLKMIWRKGELKQEGVLVLGDIPLDKSYYPKNQLQLKLKAESLDIVELADNLVWLFSDQKPEKKSKNLTAFEPSIIETVAQSAANQVAERIAIDEQVEQISSAALDVFSNLEFEVASAIIADQIITNAKGDLSGTPYSWALELASDQIIGTVTKQPMLSYQVDLEKLHLLTELEQSQAEVGSQVTLANSEKPTRWFDDIEVGSLPAMKFSSDDLQFEQKNLGKVSFNLLAEHGGNQLQDLIVNAANLNITGFASWGAGSDRQNHIRLSKTQLDFQLTSENTGEALADLGVSKTLAAASGQGHLLLSWRGSPWQFDYSRLNGSLRFNVTKGRLLDITNVQTAGRLVSLINLKALLRRLRFDFTDLYKDGFSFDRLDGDFNIDHGNAYTNNTVIDGPVAKVRLSGRTGLFARDYEQVIRVIPPVGNSLAFIAALAVNPAVGLYLWFGNRLLDKPLEKVSEFDYRLHGSWDDPQLDPISSEKASVPAGQAK